MSNFTTNVDGSVSSHLIRSSLVAKSSTIKNGDKFVCEVVTIMKSDNVSKLQAVTREANVKSLWESVQIQHTVSVNVVLHYSFII